MILPVLLLLAADRAIGRGSAASDRSVKEAAGAVVRSKEWIVRRGKAREEEFVGDVRYDAAGTRVSADWALYRQGPDDWQARGRVYGRRELSDGVVVEARGEKASFARRGEKGVLQPAPGGRVSLVRTPPGGAPDRAEGDRLDWTGEREAVLAGSVRGWGPRGELWADKAAYARSPARSVTLTGGRPAARPLRDEGAAALEADAIVVSEPPRRVEARGRAIGWVLMAPAPPSPKAKKDAAACVEKSAPVPPAAGDAVSLLLAPEAGADRDERFWRAESAAAAGRSCWGPRLAFWADSAVAEESPRRRLTLSGGRPVLRKLDADWNGAIKADAIVAYDAPRRVEAEGGVKGWIVFDEREKDRKGRRRR